MVRRPVISGGRGGAGRQGVWGCGLEVGLGLIDTSSWVVGDDQWGVISGEWGMRAAAGDGGFRRGVRVEDGWEVHEAGRRGRGDGDRRISLSAVQL